jgi:hypothetical protein
MFGDGKPIVAVVLVAILSMGIGLTGTGSVAATGNAFVVKRDKGGVIAKYHRKAQQLESASRAVIIDGLCASACTAFLKNACATQKARIGFHQARLRAKARGRYKSERERRLMVSMTRYLDRLLVSHYPPRVRRWISRNGGLPPSDKVLWLEGAEAQRVLGACR